MDEPTVPGPEETEVARSEPESMTQSLRGVGRVLFVAITGAA
ncbi:MAG TPA: hypothetical protein VK831_00790 [Candidatus Deferrimicrobiaceae bacterium]|nr:hypothetical protein [Candidatus Deferrimicrobiaceae bacterium]